MKTISPVYTQTDITHGAAVRVMHVRCRALCRLVLTGLAISSPGVLLDVDHWYCVVKGLGDVRWLHCSLASAPAVLVLLSVLWGLVATAFTIGWGSLEPVLVETPLIELPQLVAVARAADASPRDD
jgi:hypothetical protein